MASIRTRDLTTRLSLVSIDILAQAQLSGAPRHSLGVAAMKHPASFISGLVPEPSCLPRSTRQPPQQGTFNSGFAFATMRQFLIDGSFGGRRGFLRV